MCHTYEVPCFGEGIIRLCVMVTYERGYLHMYRLHKL